ncbi:hypothetical protein [Kocuria marina]|uniref:hypothetical protein n=1 Tax=Kocuria marina TaxID=223184 RepID=UPI00272EE3BC
MNPLRPLTIPTYRTLFAAMVLTIFAQGAWALYLAMQTLDLGATPATLSGVVAWSGIGLLAGSLPAGCSLTGSPTSPSSWACSP